MDSLHWLMMIFGGLVGFLLVFGLYVMWVRHRSLVTFMAREKGDLLLFMVQNLPTPRLPVCACCGKPVKTAKDRANCLRNTSAKSQNC